MTAPDAVVRIVAEVLGHLGYAPDLPSDFCAGLDALAHAGWLHDPAEVAALRVVADAARELFWAVKEEADMADRPYPPVLRRLEAGFDALPPADTAPASPLVEEPCVGLGARMKARRPRWA